MKKTVPGNVFKNDDLEQNGSQVSRTRGICMSHQNRRSNHSRQRVLETLEDRCVLSASLPTGVDLVTNGDFESSTNELAADWNTDVPVVEFQAVANRGDVARVNSGVTISQTVNVIDGQQYLLTLEYRTAGGSSNAELTIAGNDSTYSVLPRWQTASTLLTATGDSLDIQISIAAGDAFIDCVQLVPVQEISLTNSSFEEASSTENQYFKSNDFSGWDSVGDKRVKNLNVRRTGGSEGDRFLNIDGNDNLLDRVFQDVATEANENFFVSFDIKSPNGNSSLEDELRVRWNNGFAGSFRGDTDWTNTGFFGQSDSDQTRLLFREVGLGGSLGDGIGPHIDNVRVFQVMPGQDSLSVQIADPTAAEFAENGGPVDLFSNNLVLGNSVNGQLTGAVVKLTNLMDNPDEERLAVDVGQTGISASYDAANSRLRLTGQATVAEYQAVLNTLTYDNLSENPDETQRRVRISVDFGTTFSQAEFVDVNLTAVNDRPEMPGIGDQSVTVLTTYQFDVGAVDAEDSELSYFISSTGTAIGEGDALPTISDEGVINWTPQQSGSVEITVTARDSEGLGIHRVFTVTAELNAPIPENFAPFSGTRQLSNTVPSLRNSIYSSAPTMNIDLDKEYRAQIHTDDGIVEILLYDNDTPETVNNFVNLARDGFYDGLGFHRVISLTGSPTSGFIAQGGDPQGQGFGGPGYQFADENLGNAIFDKPVIAMANSGTNTNGSQFFLTLDDQVQHLNGNHTIFGEIVAGLDVANQINRRSPGDAIPAEVIRKVTIIESE